MNYIFIDGMAVYVFIFLMVVFVLIAITAVLSAIINDCRYQKVQTDLLNERKKFLLVNRENIRLKIKCGEFTGENEDV